MKRIYVCNDTVTGILSAIYDAWKKEKNSENCSIAFRGKVEAELFCDYVEVEETEHKARAVEAMICKHLGESVYGDLYYAMLSATGRRQMQCLERCWRHELCQTAGGSWNI